MGTDRDTRKLRAILSADVKGYSLLMADDEAHTIQTLKVYRDLMSDLIQNHSGRVVDNPGDNLLAEFSSAVNAVESAVEIQNRLKKENAKFVEEKRLQFRIGVNIGDVVHDDDRIYGSGVNVAARIEGVADPGGICISRNTYDHVKDKVDLDFEFLGEHEVKNIEEPVRVYRVLLDVEAAKALVEEQLELPDKPSIAALPFDNMSGDPSQEYFSDGLTEQIINGLCKVSNLFVIARNSSFAYKGKSVSVKQIAKELGVRYILEGSVQRAGERVRITAQLIDATTDYHMWSENFDRELEDIFALQDEITMKLISLMEVHLTFGEQARIWAGSTTNIQAYDSVMRGFECFYRHNDKDMAQAKRFGIDAIACDKEYAFAYVLVGMTHFQEMVYGWSKEPIVSFEKAEHYARKALTISDHLDVAHLLLGWINMMKRQFNDAMKEGEKAVELNPNGAHVHANYGNMLSFTEAPNRRKGIEFIKRAIRLNPIPPSMYHFFLGMAYRNNGQYEKAIEQCQRGLEIDPDAAMPYTTLASSSILLNRNEEGKAYAEELLRKSPDSSISRSIVGMPFKDPSQLDLILNALRKAGIPD